MACRVVHGGLRGNWHAWVTLDDGTIVDGTIEQYIHATFGHYVDAHEVPWLTSCPEYPDAGWRNRDHALAVIRPGHPLHSEYHTEPGVV